MSSTKSDCLTKVSGAPGLHKCDLKESYCLKGLPTPCIWSEEWWDIFRGCRCWNPHRGLIPWPVSWLVPTIQEIFCTKGLSLSGPMIFSVYDVCDDFVQWNIVRGGSLLIPEGNFQGFHQPSSICKLDSIQRTTANSIVCPLSLDSQDLVYSAWLIKDSTNDYWMMDKGKRAEMSRSLGFQDTFLSFCMHLKGDFVFCHVWS